MKQDWRLKLVDSPFPGTFSEIRDMQYIDDRKNISFNTGCDYGLEVYDMKKNLKWRVAPAEGGEDIPSLRGNTTIWWKAKRLFIAFNADQVVRF